MEKLECKPLTEQNFEEFSSFLNCQDTGCYCSFWHQKISSMDEWDKRKAENPELNKSCVLDKVRSKFHLGVLVYREKKLVAWVSVGPLIDFYWAWKRVVQVGEDAKNIAGITCITRKTDVRDSLPESNILEALKIYGKERGWTSIEGYPFDRSALDKHGKALTWAGFPEDFESANFQRTGEHWLSSAEATRSVYQFKF
ncbi:MAG: hypothetical protein WC635_14590 [Bacteriovorax sp.]|jgi:hypothetical protein